MQYVHAHTNTHITLHARATYFSTRGRHTLRQISGNIEAKNKCVGRWNVSMKINAKKKIVSPPKKYKFVG